MRTLVVDTNVVSALFRRRDSRDPSWPPDLAEDHLAISFMTKAELLLWPLSNNWGERRRELLAKHVEDFTTLPADERTYEIWAEVTAERRRLGRPIGAADAWIASAAIQWDVPLVTENVRDFEGIRRLRVIPFSAAEGGG